MKKVLTILLVMMGVSCKKDGAPPNTSPDLGNPNNIITADVFVHGEKAHLSAAGNNTSWEKQDYNFDTRDVDSVLVIGGSVPMNNGDVGKGITIFLGNIKTTGTYKFNQLGSDQSVEIVYGEGRVCPSTCLGPTYFGDSKFDEGELVIESISDKHIKGSFKTACFPVYYVDSTDIAEITNGTFSMDFD